MKVEIPIIYEDNHLLVVEKPINILSQADRTKDPDMLSALKLDIKERYQKPGNVYLGLIHRLDRPVGGVMVFAKTSKAAGRLGLQVREHSLNKTYLAVVNGVLSKPEGRLVHYLKKNRRTNTVTSTKSEVPGSKQAILTYQLLAVKNRISLVKVQLETGRSHQIRVQFASEGHPLVGDQKYGKHINKKPIQIALWSYLLGFDHPTTKESLKFQSLPPQVYPWDQFTLHLY